MTTNHLAPVIRFKGFTDAWEQRKLNHYLETSKEKNLDLTYGLNDVLSVSGDYGIVNQIKFQGRSFAGKSLIAYGIVKKNDVVYTKSPLKVNPYGIIKCNLGNPGIVSTLYAVYRPRETANSQFIEYYFTNDFRLNRYLKPLVNKGAKNDMKVSDDNALIGNVCFPKEKEEQTKIAYFFKQLDDTIALHQRELDLLKEQKKGFLQKMFPKKDEVVPEIRFAGFTDAWEQRKLGEVAERVTRKNENLETSLPLTISAQYGLVDQITFFNKQVASKNMENYYLLHRGEFAYNKSYSNGFPFGTVKRLDKYDMGALSTLYIVFKPIKVVSDFLVTYYDTTRWHKEVSARAAEGARNHGLLNISTSDFFDTNLILPSTTDEQTKIGNFFKQLDDTIALHQCELEKLQEMKKAFLQKMFV